MRGITHMERLELTVQRLRSAREMETAELQMETMKAIDEILMVLKEQKRRLDEIEVTANRRRFWP